MSTTYDLVVIGGGPAGYVGAIHAAQHGMKVALVEKRSTLGGTCLNIGCIPTKALLFSAAHYDKAKKLSSYGVRIKGADAEGGIELDFAQVNKRKNDIVKQITGGVAFLIKKNKIDLVKGHGRLTNATTLDATTLDVTADDGSVTTLTTKNVLIATGSKVRSLPNVKIDGNDVISSDEILFLDKVPESLGIIGGGVIGCEFASCYGRFGSKVTLFEVMEQLVPTEDGEVAAELAKQLRRQNCDVLLGTRVQQVVSQGGSVAVHVEGEAEPRRFEKVLVSIGRAPVTEDIGLDKAGVALGKGGFIPVDLNSYRTNVSNIYAAGDIIPTPQLAHTASAEAIFAVDIMLGKKRSPINYQTNPSAIYTYPEVASVGLNEQTLKAQNRDFKVGKFPFSAIGKARIEDATDGFVKMLVCPKTGEVLGVHIVHAKATELIAEIVLGKNIEMKVDDLALSIHPHPTISEVVMEAAHAAMGHAIHL